MSTEQIARWTIGLVWIFHGLFIKLVTIAPIELYINSQIGLSENRTYWLIKFAGIGEVAFGLVFICLYRYKQVIYLNIFALVSLIIMVAVLDIRYLIEGFNPVTTNIPIIALSFILLKERNKNPIAKELI